MRDISEEIRRAKESQGYKEFVALGGTMTFFDATTPTPKGDRKE